MVYEIGESLATAIENITFCIFMSVMIYSFFKAVGGGFQKK